MSQKHYHMRMESSGGDEESTVFMENLTVEELMTSVSSVAAR